MSFIRNVCLFCNGVYVFWGFYGVYFKLFAIKTIIWLLLEVEKQNWLLNQEFVYLSLNVFLLFIPISWSVWHKSVTVSIFGEKYKTNFIFHSSIRYSWNLFILQYITNIYLLQISIPFQKTKGSKANIDFRLEIIRDSFRWKCRGSL